MTLNPKNYDLPSNKIHKQNRISQNFLKLQDLGLCIQLKFGQEKLIMLNLVPQRSTKKLMLTRISLQSQSYKINGHKFSDKKVNHKMEIKNYKNSLKLELLNSQKKARMKKKMKKLRKQIEEFEHREVIHLVTKKLTEILKTSLKLFQQLQH